MLCAIRLSVITFKARSIERRRAQSAHAPEWSLTSGLCGELGPVTPNRMHALVGRLSAWQCSGNILLVQHKLTNTNVELEAWMDWHSVW